MFHWSTPGTQTESNGNADPCRWMLTKRFGSVAYSHEAACFNQMAQRQIGALLGAE
jgi:hypothetical protein